MRLVLAGPVLVALGSRRLGPALSLASAAAFADIALRGVVPGANDNLTSVAVLCALGRALVEQPVGGLRVVLLSAGGEESFEEGSQAFLARHAADLPPHRTAVIALETVGSPRLILVEGEGMVVPTPYDDGLKDVIAAAAADAGVEIVREHWLGYGSDALAGVRAGYASALIASFDEHKLPSNYHQPTDVPANVDYGTVAQAVRVADAAVRRLASA